MLSLKGMAEPLNAGVHPQILERWRKERGITRGTSVYGEPVEDPVLYPTSYGLQKFLRSWVKVRPDNVGQVGAFISMLPGVFNLGWGKLSQGESATNSNFLACMDVFRVVPSVVVCYSESGDSTTPTPDSLFFPMPKTSAMIAIRYEYGDLVTGLHDGLLVRTATYNRAVRRLTHANRD